MNPMQQLAPNPRAGNAWRNGMYARQVTVREEEREDFEQLREAMVEQWRPKNVSMWLLVDQLARLHWRLMRAGEAETLKLDQLHEKRDYLPYVDKTRTTHFCTEHAMADDVGGSDSKLARLQLYQLRLERSIHRTIALLITLRKSRVKQGNPSARRVPEKLPQPITVIEDVAQPRLQNSTIKSDAPAST